jgi:hypothetical protein
VLIVVQIPINIFKHEIITKAVLGNVKR